MVQDGGVTDTVARTAPTVADAGTRRATVLASLAAMLLGSGLSVLVHEIGHWVAGAALGHPSRLYAFAVSHGGEQSASDVAVMALAGPAASLVIGLVMTTWTPLRRAGGTAHLLWLWIGFTSLQEFVTYLVITPFGAGDTAMAVAALGWGTPAMFIALAIGIGGMFWQAWRFALHLWRHSGGDHARANHLAWHPWLLGVGWMILVQAVLLLIAPASATAGEGGLTPGLVIVLLMASMSITVFAPMGFIFLSKRKTAAEPLTLPSFPTGLVIGYAVLLVVNVVLTLTGPTLG